MPRSIANRLLRSRFDRYDEALRGLVVYVASVTDFATARRRSCIIGGMPSMSPALARRIVSAAEQLTFPGYSPQQIADAHRVLASARTPGTASG